MSVRSQLSRVLSRLLSLLRKHHVLFTLIAALLIVGITDILIDSVFHTHRTVGIEMGIEVVIVFVGVAVPAGLAFAALWPELKTMLDVTSKAPPKSAPILLRIVREELKQLEQNIADVRSRGTRVGRNDVTPWIRKRCFAAASGAYSTTDLLVPSVFLSRYRSYLAAHADYVRRTACDSVRVNLAPTKDLAADRRKNPKLWDEYVNWHKENGVELLHLDRARALDIARETDMGKTIDFAIWKEELVILVDDQDDGDTILSLAFADEHLYRCCDAFLTGIQDIPAGPFDQIQPSTPPWTAQLKSAIRRPGRSWPGRPVRRA